jgi:hypothetical protein
MYRISEYIAGTTTSYIGGTFNSRGGTFHQIYFSAFLRELEVAGRQADLGVLLGNLRCCSKISRRSKVALGLRHVSLSGEYAANRAADAAE